MNGNEQLGKAIKENATNAWATPKSISGFALAATKPTPYNTLATGCRDEFNKFEDPTHAAMLVQPKLKDNLKPCNINKLV